VVGDVTISESVDFVSGAPVAADLDVQWIHGSRSAKRNTDPPIQVHACDEHTFVLRQNKAVNYEAPFLYLFLGNDRALLLDTGATKDPAAFPLRDTVDGILHDWLAGHPRDSYELVVAHTHGHNDHVAGDSQFDGRPSTTLVPADQASACSFFGISDWPAGIVAFDLGGRVLELTGCPGHDDRSIAVYDPWTGFLITGDTVYPGRLFVRDMPAFTASLERLADFARARPVTDVLGCHIEMSRSPGRVYPLGATYQPDEAALPMTVTQLVAVRDAARSMAGRTGYRVFGDFAIVSLPSKAAMARLVASGIWWKLRNRIPF
jgi:hydroxyacylglutathione hydrolase